MANISFLLEPTFNVNPLLQHAFRLPPVRSPVMNLSYGYNNALKSNFSSLKLIRYSPKLRSKCFCMSPKPQGENVISGNGGQKDGDLMMMAEADLSKFTPVEKTSVVKLQVGLLGTCKSLQRNLDQIAEVADTSSPQGLSYILQETILALLRHPDYCISAYSSVDAKRDMVEVEELFNELCIDERAKFDEETLVNVDNIKKQIATTQTSKDLCNEYIVITIIVVAGGVVKLPPISSSATLKEALKKLAAIPSSRVKAVEVLWTPQEENDILTEKEYFEDYSQLRPL